MSEPVYIPNLKTSDSELRALRHLSTEVRNRILPAFEITRSRITTKNPEGSVFRRAEQLIEACGMSKFILDITTETDLMNQEMEGFFDEAAGYAAWRDFLATSFGNEIVPCAQYVDGGGEQEFKRQIDKLVTHYGTVALRTSVSDRDDTRRLYEWALEVTPSQNIILIGSLYFLEQGHTSIYLDRCRLFLRDVVGNRPPKLLAFPGSSFPKAVGSGEYGEDGEGQFAAIELPLYKDLEKSFGNLPLIYSDYAAVHPIRYPTRGGSWVPRIDVVYDGHFAFSRLRNPDGGYAAAARAINGLYGKSLPECWGSEQIKLAAHGTVPGRSPSYWISARINMWITQRAYELREE